MDYNIMPPPSSNSVTAASLMTENNIYSSTLYSHSSPNQIYNNEGMHQASSSQYSTPYKPHLSRRANVNRPPPLSLSQTFYRESSIAQSTQGIYHSSSDVQSPHVVQSPRVAVSPHPHSAQSPLINHSPHVIDQPPRSAPILLHRQSSQHILHSPLHQSYPNNDHMTGNAHSATGHIFAEPNHNQMSSIPYEQIASSPLRRKPRHYSDSSTRSPHPYNTSLHHYNNPPSAHHYNDPSPSPHHYSDITHSPHHFSEPTPSPHHFNDPIPSPHPYQDPSNSHRAAFLESSQPGTPAGYINSHPGTPAATGFVGSPHHLSPHPTRSAYQHFFGPNVCLPLSNSGSSSAMMSDNTTCDVPNVAQFNTQKSADNSQNSTTGALLHASSGGQGDAMLSSISISQQDQDANVLQDTGSSMGDSVMDTDWSPGVPHSIKSGSQSGSVQKYMFEADSNPPDVDELLSQATDFIANTNTLSLSDSNVTSKDSNKCMKSRPKGRPTKTSPRTYGAQCAVCSKTFNNSSALAKHKLTHSDERKYVCQLCSKAFKRQDHLNGHMMTHRTKKPFECTFDGCTKSYCDARSLRRHLENHHNVPPETLYDMSLSNYGMPNGTLYPSFPGDATSPSPHASPSYQTGQGHQSLFRFDSSLEQNDSTAFVFGGNETSQAPAECSICHKKFKNLPALNGHMRLHGGYASIKQPELGRGSSIDDTAHKTESMSCDVASTRIISPSDRQTMNNITQEKRESGSSNQYLLNNKTGNVNACVTEDNLPASQSRPNINLNLTLSGRDQGNVKQDGGRSASLVHLGMTEPALTGQSSSEPSRFFTAQTGGLLTRGHTSFPSIENPGLNTINNQNIRLPLGTSARFSQMNAPTLPSDQAMYLFSQQLYSSGTADDHIQHPNVAQSFDDDHVGFSPFLYSEKHSEDKDVDHEVSQINTFKTQKTGEHDQFLAEKKRHASAPEKYIENWTSHAFDKQQQLNERLAQANQRSFLQSQLSNIGNRRRRSSADNHNEILASSDGAMIFRSPPPGGLKKKHRPEPLVIPPNVTAVQSRLRSPRIWEPADQISQRRTGKTPPPYTPPPILSPLRSGTGLFHLMNYNRSASVNLSASLPAGRFAHTLKTQSSIIEQLDEESHQRIEEKQPLVSENEEAVAAEVIPPPLETDIEPHINIGPSHQAALPMLEKNRKHAARAQEHATLLWSPYCIEESVTSNELTAYMDFSCSAAIPGSGSNKEYALHQLFFNKGDLSAAVIALMNKDISPEFMDFIGDYHYQDSDVWTTEDIEQYTEAIMKEDKDFTSINKAFKDRKSHKQCVEFYYMWKKICPDEYKKLRIYRRKKRSDDLYNLRSRGDKSKPEQQPTPGTNNYEDEEEEVDDEDIDDEQAEEMEDSVSQVSDDVMEDDDPIRDAPSSMVSTTQHFSSLLPGGLQHPLQSTVLTNFTCDYPGCNAVFSSKQALNGHVRIHVLTRPVAAVTQLHSERAMNPVISVSQLQMQTLPQKKVKAEPQPIGSEQYPCKLCGKVFYKVKSRSAHMKSHSVLAKKQKDGATQPRATL